jgi:acetyl-CoA C-acetyltransferase
MAEAYIYDAVRTPRGKGKKDGSLHEITGLSLATQVLEALRDRNDLDTSKVDDVILGCVTPVGELGADIARTAVLSAGWAQTTAGVQVNRFCASGLEAVNMAAAKVKAGEADFAVGGGIEAMSRVPMGSDGGAWPVDPSSAFPTYFVPQGVSADMIATKYGFSRDDVDAYSMESHKRAAAAWADGRFSKSVIPVKNQLGLVQLDRDETIRPNTDMQTLGALNASFAMMGEMAFDSVINQRYPEVERVNHVHTPGNSSGIVDGSAGVLIGTLEAGQALGLKPRARIVGAASIGSEPSIMLTGPEFVTKKLLGRLGMTTADIDVWELNEAFAAVVLRYMQALDIPHDKMNVNGGGISMGHPLGATGAMITGIALDELERSGQSTALITLCIGGGMGTATVIERV